MPLNALAPPFSQERAWQEQQDRERRELMELEAAAHRRQVSNMMLGTEGCQGCEALGTQRGRWEGHRFMSGKIDRRSPAAAASDYSWMHVKRWCGSSENGGVAYLGPGW